MPKLEGHVGGPAEETSQPSSSLGLKARVEAGSLQASRHLGV